MTAAPGAGAITVPRLWAAVLQLMVFAPADVVLANDTPGQLTVLSGGEQIGRVDLVTGEVQLVDLGGSAPPAPATG